MTIPSLIKRLEAIEGIQGSGKPIMMFHPYRATEAELAAFEADLAARLAASPGSAVTILAWAEGE